MGIAAQQKWINKLLKFDFVINYKKGKENIVASALSWKKEQKGVVEESLAMISFPNLFLLEELKKLSRISRIYKNLESAPRAEYRKKYVQVTTRVIGKEG